MLADARLLSSKILHWIAFCWTLVPKPEPLPKLRGLEPDLTSYNAAMTACERGSQWQQAAIVKTTCTTFAQQWIWNDDSVSMKSLQTLQVCRYWQVILQRQSRELKALQFLFKPSLRTLRSTWTHVRFSHAVMVLQHEQVLVSSCFRFPAKSHNLGLNNGNYQHKTSKKRCIWQI